MAEGGVRGVSAPRLPTEPHRCAEEHHADDRGHHALVIRPDHGEHALKIGEPCSRADGEAQNEVREEGTALHGAANLSKNTSTALRSCSPRAQLDAAQQLFSELRSQAFATSSSIPDTH